MKKKIESLYYSKKMNFLLSDIIYLIIALAIALIVIFLIISIIYMIFYKFIKVDIENKGGDLIYNNSLRSPAPSYQSNAMKRCESPVSIENCYSGLRVINT
jgi:hypothetical protein